MFSSIATVSISGSLDGKLRAIAEAGFAGVEIFENDLLAYPGTVREVAGLLRDLGLRCTVFQPFRDFEGMPEELRRRTFDRVERKFDVMQELGTDLLLVCSNVSPAALPDRNRITNDFCELGERALARGLRVGFEALAWGRHIWDHRDAWSVVKAVNHKAIGLVLDTFHSLARAVPNESLRDIDVAKVFLLQIADAPWLTMDPLSWSRHFRCMPGQGDLPLIEYVGILQEAGYRGPWSLEIFNDRLRAASATLTAVDGMRSLLLLQDQIRQKFRPTEPAAMPPPVRCLGVEFIELCSSEAEAPLLEAMIHSLGFAPVGRHRSKAVTRWQQGQINIVLNTEPESFAHSYDVVHGASVCAIGLRVEKVSDVLDRARALRMAVYTQPVAPGERELPAVRGLGGSLVYFLEDSQTEDVWASEFLALAATAARGGAGLLQVDHIAQCMNYEEMPSWVLFYIALFDVQKGSPVEIPDPQGLVVTQEVQSPDGKLQLTLNGSAAAQTLASRFLSHFVGAGIQHLTLSSTDIFASAAALQNLGLAVLPIPANYYDDLAARFGLEDAFVERMAGHNILYDRDDSGEYLQLFSRAFAKRFFFEIAERRGYRGSAASNAAVRMAAQSRYKSDP